MLFMVACSAALPPQQPIMVGASAITGEAISEPITTAHPDKTANTASTVVLAHLYAAALRFYGSAADVVVITDPVAALDSAEVTVTPGFTGLFLQRFSPRSTVLAESQVYRALVGALPEGIAASDYTLAAQNQPALAVTQSTAESWDSQDLTAFVTRCSRMRVGALKYSHPPARVGSCTISPTVNFDDESSLFAAVRSNVISAAWTTTASTIVPTDMVLLADGTPALIRAYNIVALYRRNELREDQVLAINQLAGVLTTAALIDMCHAVSAGADPQLVAESWLAEHPLGR